ncbi:MAG: peptidylprolyl isomerase [Pseudomonadota bacterium]|nr:peptidylprolyl isomerase [Pseudomonadota bacterium]
MVEETAARIAPDEADPVVARVDGTVIRRSDVEREAQSQSGDAEAAPAPGEAEFERVLDELIDQRLLALEARRRGLHQSEEARRRMALAEERILGNVLVETALADAVTEETIQRIYREQVRLIPLGEEVRARHILVDTRAEAEAIVAQLEAGRDFAELAVAMSQDQATRLEGGDLGYFTRQGVLPAFGSVAFSTPEGEVSEPFRSEFGWHLLKVVDRRRQPPPSLEALRPNIVRFYTFDQLEGLIDGLREEAEIERPQILIRPDPEPAEADGDVPEDGDSGDEPG